MAPKSIITLGDFLTLVSDVSNATLPRNADGSARPHDVSAFLCLNSGGEPSTQGMLVFAPGMLVRIRDAVRSQLGYRVGGLTHPHADAIVAVSAARREWINAFWSIAAFSDKSDWEGFNSDDPDAVVVAHVLTTMLSWMGGFSIARECSLNVLALCAGLRSWQDLVVQGRPRTRLRPQAASSIARNLGHALARSQFADTEACKKFLELLRLPPAEREFVELMVQQVRLPTAVKSQYIHAQRLPWQRRAYIAVLVLLLRRYGYPMPMRINPRALRLMDV